MDADAIITCSDEKLREEMHVDAFGDILAIKNFAMQKISNVSNDEWKLELIYAIKGGNIKRQKTTRKVQLGWQNFNLVKRKYTNVKKYGGARQVDIPCNASKDDIKKLAEEIFFPNKKSHLGILGLFKTDFGNFSCSILNNTISGNDGVEHPFTLESYVKTNKLSHVRLYLLTR